MYILQEYYGGGGGGGGGGGAKYMRRLENIYALYVFCTNFLIFGPILTQKCNLEPQFC